VLSNEMPRLTDASGALVSRMIVLRLTESWYGEEDTKLTGKLLEELPGILWWAIGGWQQLQKRGCLLQPASGNELIEELEELASPIGTFLEEECVTGSEHRIARSVLFEAFTNWCKRKGRDFVTDEAGFGKGLRAVYPKLTSARPNINRVKARCYVGVNLRVEGCTAP